MVRVTYPKEIELRELDVNSLLRLYDEVKVTRVEGKTQSDRNRADLALPRIVDELRRRSIRI